MKTIKLPMLWLNKFPITITYNRGDFFGHFFRLPVLAGIPWGPGPSVTPKFAQRESGGNRIHLRVDGGSGHRSSLQGKSGGKFCRCMGGGVVILRFKVLFTKQNMEIKCEKNILIKMPIGSFWMFLIFLNYVFSIVVRAEVCEAFLLPISKDQWVRIEMAKIVVMNTKGPTIQPFSRRTDHPSSPHNFWITQGSSNYPFYGNFEGFPL